METEILAFLKDSGITGVLIVALGMVYRGGKFFAPLITSYIERQIVNAETTNKILNEFALLQSTANMRLSAIEKQLSLFEGFINEDKKSK
jgi:hypothetical protein